tara:strand:- start:401 stop:1141 length:741 start_codon:yes stop_codon:yes gene_type:complete
MKKNVLITGSSKGIGFSIAKKFSESGYKVILNGRNSKNLIRAKNKIKDSFIERGDLSKEKECNKIIKNIIDKHKKLDILVCNIGNGSPRVIKSNYNKWISYFNDNFFSAINIIEQSKKYLAKTKGSIICISSICGIETIKNAPVEYSVTKSALNSYVKLISMSLGSQKIKINAIAPGNIFFKGSVWEKKLISNKRKTLNYIKENVPLKKLGNPEDISELCLYLCSDKSNFITGAVFTVDGGQTKKF